MRGQLFTATLLLTCCCGGVGAAAGVHMPIKKKFTKARVGDNGTSIRQQRFYSKLKPRHQLLPSLLSLVNSLVTLVWVDGLLALSPHHLIEGS